jgi:hypothetical protein
MGYALLLMSFSKPATETALDASEILILLCGVILAIGAAGEYTEEHGTLPRWMKWSMRPKMVFVWMVALSLVGEFVGDAGVFIFSGHLQTINDGEYAALNKEAGNARRDAGNANKEAGIARRDASNANALAQKYQSEIAASEAQVATAMAASAGAVAKVAAADARSAEASAKAEGFRLDIAKAQESAARATEETARITKDNLTLQADILKLQGRLADRVFTADQRFKFAAALNGKTKFPIKFESSVGEEPVRYARQIMSALAGWDVDSNSLGRGILTLEAKVDAAIQAMGLLGAPIITFGPSSKTSNVVVLEDAFSAAGVKTAPPIQMTKQTTDEIVVYIPQKPP